MDYTLYRNFDEQEPTYDYFAVKTNAWVTKPFARTDSLDGIFTRYSLPKIGDNLLETGPQTKRDVGTLDINIGYGGGITGGVGFSVDLSDFSPDIIQTQDFTDDTVEWEMKKRFWFPPNMDNATLYCVASWASTGNWAAIDVSFKGRMLIAVSDSYNISCTGEYMTIPVRFSY